MNPVALMIAQRRCGLGYFRRDWTKPAPTFRMSVRSDGQDCFIEATRTPGTRQWSRRKLKRLAQRANFNMTQNWVPAQ